MRVWGILLLTAVSVWGFPERRSDKQPLQQELTQLQQYQQKGKSVRDCKGTCNSKCATSIAQKACAEAKAAQAAQNAAGAQAAHMVKTQLAEKALQAAKAAEAALAGKQAVVEQLQQEVKEAQAAASEGNAGVKQQQATVGAACVAAQQAVALQKILDQAANMSVQLQRQVAEVLEMTRLGLQMRYRVLTEARSRLAYLQHRLQCACVDCSTTRDYAYCACKAAKDATSNVRKKRKTQHCKPREGR